MGPTPLHQAHEHTSAIYWLEKRVKRVFLDLTDFEGMLSFSKRIISKSQVSIPQAEEDVSDTC